MQDRFKFLKVTDTLYIPYKNNRQIAGRGIRVYKRYDNTDFYEVDGYLFDTLKEAKEYIKTNY